MQKLLKTKEPCNFPRRLYWVHHFPIKPSQNIATQQYNIPERLTISFRRLLRNYYFYSLSKMKFSAFATLFAALLVSGQAVNPEANAVDASPVANVVDVPAPEAAADTSNERQVRGATDGQPAARDLSCRLCCSDDIRC